MLAQGANAAFIADGADGLRRYAGEQREHGIELRLFQNGQDVLSDRPLPPPLHHHLSQLLEADGIELRPMPGLQLSGQRVTGSDGITRQLVGLRGHRPPHARIEQLLLVQVVLSLLVIGAVGWWLARSISRPVVAVGAAAQQLAAGKLAARVDSRWTSAGDEVGALARDFDRMAARIETLVATQRTVLQDVSHELRSPLARLHVLLELARQGANDDGGHQLDRATREVSRLDTLIGQTLELSRMEAALPGLAPVPVDLSALLDEVLDEHALEAEARRIVLQTPSTSSIQVSGDPRLLSRAIGNLLANAVKFSPEGGVVELALSTSGAKARLSIRDHGPGVPQENIARLFQPFYRGDNAALAGGHGLGLAIAQRIVNAHQGQLRVGNAVDGGFEAEIQLPLKV